MNLRPSDLFVAWQDTLSRGIYPVARLRVAEAEEPRYEFRYIRGALEAKSRGFVEFDSFPELERTYRSDELFPFFKNRVMPPSRPDYAGYVAELGLAVETADPLDLLARSGGVRATDRLEIYAAPRQDADASVWHFLLRGVRHLPPTTEERIRRLEPGDRLYVMRDVQNQHNPRALLLRSDDKINLGYIPDLLVDDLAQLDLALESFLVTVAQVNPPPAPVQHRVLCRLYARWPAGRLPFTSERFVPLGA
jgi:hypothetical protein